MKPEQGNDLTRLLLLGGAMLLGLLLLLRIYPPMAFMAFAIGVTIGFFLLGQQVTTLFRRRGGADGDESDFARRVSERLADCRRREENFRDEGERILKSIATLRDDLARNPGADEAEVAKAQAIIKELEAEFSLRHAKASFFSECAARLRELLDRHRLVESMAARRRELRELRRTNFDDEAVVEETRFSIEQDSIQLDTIVELSNSASGSSKTEQAEALRERLERLRSTLGRRESPQGEGS
ncbi:hypothetical protein GGR26_001790 [Lewinella marina]|uniref:Uncharacterized protein n=1 Tax=Neolewinella marina TaxID=438751 RepID=A0A2G0CDH1_9BACT|nr:hypothetical protein [Neolewinella marina]NJB86022.1 hypothetical protein [Neolewinella marina]PHK98012.1 hypothetical protein CGL56_12525 [Neolewinella marina]